MNKIIIGVVGVVAVGAIAWFVSPTAKYAIKGNITKIENAAQLSNAIEILEAKNVEMQDKYMNLMIGIKQTDMQIARMNAMADKCKNKQSIKYATYTNGVAHLTVAKGKLGTMSETMKKNIIGHRSNIELLKAKLVYLDSLKTVNSYLKDTKIDGTLSSGISDIIENAIMNEEAINAAMSDIESLKADIED